MTPAERERAVAYLEQTKALILDSTATLTEAQWRFKPSSEAWSPAECIEHLALVETGLLKAIQGLAASPAAPAEVLAEIAGKEDVVIQMVRSRKRRIQAPEGGRPSNRFVEIEALRAHFSEVRDRTIAYVRTTGDPIRTRIHPHFMLGPMDGYQWLMFMGAHCERHLKQLQEALGQNSASGASVERPA
jgi:hypothetical protein